MKNLALTTLMLTLWFSGCAAQVNEPEIQTRSTLNEGLPNAKPTPMPVVSKSRPALAMATGSKARLSLGKKSAVVDLDETDGVTLGGLPRHRLKLHFATVKDGWVYYLFTLQSASPITDRNAPCGGDAPQTLIWLKADSDLKVTEARSEVIDSCAYNGGRYLQGKPMITPTAMTLIFQQGLKKREVKYDNSTPENGFTVNEQPAK